MAAKPESSKSRFPISESDDWLANRHEQLKKGVGPIVEHLASLLRKHGVAWLLIDGPQGIGKSRYIAPVFQEVQKEMTGDPSETISTDICQIPREVRNALPPGQYKDLWKWFNFRKLVRLINDVSKARRTGKSVIIITNWYNREMQGTHDKTPLSIAVKPLMILEGIGALSDEVVAAFRKHKIPFVGVLFDAPQETRFAGLLSARTYRLPEEQLRMMKIVDTSYYEHQPKLYKNADYYGFLSKTGFWVSKLHKNNPSVTIDT